MKFYSQAEVIAYLRDVADGYQKESENYGNTLGSMLRTIPGQPQAKDDKRQDKGDRGDNKKIDQKGKPLPGGWVMIGSLLLNTVNPSSATTEVMYQIHEDLKQKLAKTTEALKSFEQNAGTLVPQNAVFQLYMRNGVPERMIVEVQEPRAKTVFTYDGRFRVV